MKIGLSMVVKNERRMIDFCIGHIHDLFDDIVIVDTGSTDSTIEHLQNAYKIEVLHHTQCPIDPTNIVAARNKSIKHNKADWILVLDCDEIMSRADLLKLLAFSPATNDLGIFLKWRDFRHGSAFDDYKLFLIRNQCEIKATGIVHAVPQHSVREAGGRAIWSDLATVSHFPEKKKNRHRSTYLSQTANGIKATPNWIRYHWFHGYTMYKNGEVDEAKSYLQTAAHSHSLKFPVECLNAALILVQLLVTEGSIDEARRLAKDSLSFFTNVKEDFEVQINRRFESWFCSANQTLQNEGRLVVAAPEFAY